MLIGSLCFVFPNWNRERNCPIGTTDALFADVPGSFCLFPLFLRFRSNSQDALPDFHGDIFRAKTGDRGPQDECVVGLLQIDGNTEFFAPAPASEFTEQAVDPFAHRHEFAPGIPRCDAHGTFPPSALAANQLIPFIGYRKADDA